MGTVGRAMALDAGCAGELSGSRRHSTVSDVCISDGLEISTLTLIPSIIGMVAELKSRDWFVEAAGKANLSSLLKQLRVL